MQRRVRIAVEVMGGDFAPVETVKGALQAARDDGTEIILVGHLDAINRELRKYDTAGLPIRLFHAEELIPDGGNTIAEVRHRKDASILVASRLVKEGWADAVVSAGNSGATLLASTVELGRLPGVERPCAGACFAYAPNCFVVDIGTNTNGTAEHLFQFAVIGSVYSQTILGNPNPKVAVLSNGAEEGKGSRVTKQAYQLLKDSDLNFIGNVEGNDLVSGKADVVVCDGLMGNVLVKFMEGFSLHILRSLQAQLGAQWSSVANLPIVNQLRSMIDVLSYDGGMILGLNGVAIIVHGRSDAAMVVNGIRRARTAVEEHIVERVKGALVDEMSRVRESLLAAGA